MLSPSLPERGTKEIHSLSESARERDRLPFFVVCLLCSMIAEPAEKVNELFVFFSFSAAHSDVLCCEVKLYTRRAGHVL